MTTPNNSESDSYIPAAAVVGFQNELRRLGQHLTESRLGIVKFAGSVLKHPYALSALMCSYSIVELVKSALHAHDAGLVVISAAYAFGTLFLSLLDYGRADGKLEYAPEVSTTGPSIEADPL
jgi:hypothetical protein